MKIPLQRLRKEITSTEFVLYRERLRQRVNGFHREDYFLAQIAAEIRRSAVKKPKKVKDKDFLIKFTTEKEEMSETQQQQALVHSKAKWFGAVGLPLV